MNPQERVQLILANEVPDRIPWAVGYWEMTEAKWHEKGLPEKVSAVDYFKTDDIVRIEGDLSLQLPERSVESREGARTYWDSNGALRRDARTEHGRTTQWLEFSIRTKDDWKRYRDRATLSDTRVADATLAGAERARTRSSALFYQAHACFSATWAKVGMTNSLMLMLDEPHLVHEMYSAHTELVIDLFEEMLRRGFRFDAAFLADDLGSTSAPLISPALYREMVLPYHKRLCTYFREKELRTILHSDGNVQALVPDFLDAGFSGLHPLEAKAGLDARCLRYEYGDRLLLWGNIDVRKLAGSRDDVSGEIASKIPVAKENGGYIFSVDHGGVPSDVPFDNYRHAMELVEHYGQY